LQKVEISNIRLVIQVTDRLNRTHLYSNDPLYNATGAFHLRSELFRSLCRLYGNTTVTIHKGQLVVDLIDGANKNCVARMSQQNLAATIRTSW